MEQHPVSEMYKREVQDSWKDYDLSFFNAVTPRDLYQKHKLTFGLKDSRKPHREFTSTEKAVWYSHFELWCKCVQLNKPIIVVEHDSKLVRPLPDLSKHGYRFLSFINRDFGNKGIHLAPGSGYYITPNRASELVAKAVSTDIKQNSDGHLVRVLNRGFEKQKHDLDSFTYIEQINIDGLNTIDHRNPSRKFIGPDYENFDLSSIHGQA